MRLLAALALLAAASAHGQTLTVTSAAPANNAAGVPLASTVALTFSAPVADPQTDPPGLVWLPADSVAVGAPTRSADGRTLTFPVALRPNTRYVMLALGATGDAGEALARPFALNFTTAPSAGSFSVSGTVTSAVGAVDGAIVALVTGDLAAGTVQIAHARVLDGQGAAQAYSLGPVPLGLYTVGAVRLPLGDAVPGYGLYDPDGDGVPNPVLLPFNVNLTVGLPDGGTAADGLDDVAAAAAGVDPDATLRAVAAPAVEADGLAGVWTYTYAGAATSFSVVRLGLFVVPVQQAVPVTDPLPTPFADSDTALPAAEAAGGAAFRALHAARTVAVAALATADPAASPFGVPVWRVDYTATDTPLGPPVDALAVFLDLSTGAVLGTTAAEARPVAAARLVLRSANPFRDALRADLVLDAPGLVRVSVVDALGRTVAVLVERTLGAGTHAVQWQPGAEAPPGTFWLRAQTPAGATARAVTRLR
jgi:hypothetical protein